MNLTEMQTQLYDRLGYGSPGTDTIQRILGYINETQRKILATRGLARLRRTILTCASVQDSPFMVLPQAAVMVLGIQNRTTQKPLIEKLLGEIRFMDPGLTRSTSDPDYYAVLNVSSAVARPPSDASTLYVKSTSAGDVGTAYIEGIRTGGYYRSESVVMTGTTAVSFASTDWIDIQKFYLSTTAAGTVTLLEDSGAGTELSRIPLGRQSARYTLLHLWGTPTSALTFYCDVERHIENFVNPGDESYLPEDYHWLLTTGARMLEY